MALSGNQGILNAVHEKRVSGSSLAEVAVSQQLWPQPYVPISCFCSIHKTGYAMDGIKNLGERTMKVDIYQMLGVHKKASVREMKKAYREFAKKHHPDFFPGDTIREEQFKQVAAVYQQWLHIERTLGEIRRLRGQSEGMKPAWQERHIIKKYEQVKQMIVHQSRGLGNAIFGDAGLLEEKGLYV